MIDPIIAELGMTRKELERALEKERREKEVRKRNSAIPPPSSRDTTKRAN